VRKQLDGEQRLGSISPVGQGFAQFHGKRIAVVLMYRKRPTMFWGRSRFENNEQLGPVLRIRLTSVSGAGETDVIISEQEWNGHIVPDSHYGCDYCFIPANRSQPSEIGQA
jgi:hypothetical protein